MALTRVQLTFAVFVPLSYIAWGYLTYWIPRIHLLPYAFAAGIVAAVLGFVALIGLSSAQPKQRDQYASYAPTTAAFGRPGTWEEARSWLSASRQYRKKTLLPTQPAISRSIDEVLDWVYRDFVTSWYGNVSKEPAFVNEVDCALRGAFWTIRGRLEDQDLIKTAVSRFVPIVTDHLRHFGEAEIAVRGRDLSRSVTESEELDLAIASKYKDGKLHPAAAMTFSDLKLVQQEYIRRLVKKLLPKVLPASFVASKAVCVLIEEIVSCAVLVPVMQLLADPDTWNQIVEAYGRTILKDRKSVQKLRKALDEHASPVAHKTAPRTFPRLSPDDDERKFERFVRAIRKCNNLSEARRFRSEVASQLKRAVDAGVKDQAYVRRLETSKRLLDQRVGLLSAVGSSSDAPALPETKTDGNSKASNQMLQDVLYSASGLSYFMEFMDRLGLMTLVQFYIVVDGFRNPLEDDFIEGHKVAESSLKWTESDRQDIAQINQGYLSRLELRVSSSLRESVRHFLKAGRNATPVQYQRARSAILKAQTQVLEEMKEKYFPQFRDSDLWYKYVTAEEAAAKTSRPAQQAPKKRPPPIQSDLERSSLDMPRAMVRSETQTLRKHSADLTRNIKSATNLHSLAKDRAESPAKGRTSFDFDPSKPLFEDEVEPEAMGESIASLDDYDDMTPAVNNGDQTQVVDAMQAALDDIMADGDKEPEIIPDTVMDPPIPHRPSLFGDDAESRRGSAEIIRSDSPIPGKRGKPDLASLGLVNTSSRIGVFRDDDLFGDEPKFKEDEEEEPETPADEKSPDEEIHQAAPGDLGLAEAISTLTVEIDKLVAQENIVDTLNRKAELTNNVAELRILRKSKESLQREIHRKELQRQQYIVQESDNSLYGRASIQINSVVVGKEPDGQEFALYVVEVRRQAGEHMPAASWAIARRYSEFHELHHRLRSIYPAVRELDFPRRRIMMKLQRDFLQKRRVSLQTYLCDLLQMPDVCQSRDLRAFLSQSAIVSTDPTSQNDGEGGRADIVSRIYNSVTDGMDEFLGNIPVLDQLTTAGQNLISAATAQYADAAQVTATATTPSSAGAGDMPIGPADVAAASVPRAREAQAELDALDGDVTSSSSNSSSAAAALAVAAAQQQQPFIKPISDLFLETFELNRSSANWLRGRAVVVVLHQLLGGTVERKMRELAASLAGQERVLQYVEQVKRAFWVVEGEEEEEEQEGVTGGEVGKRAAEGGGVTSGSSAAAAAAAAAATRLPPRRRDRLPRTAAQKKASRKEAGVTLAHLVPELAGNVVGRDNARRAARKLFAAANNDRLNAQLAFRLLDEVVCLVWPDMASEVGRM